MKTGYFTHTKIADRTITPPGYNTPTTLCLPTTLLIYHVSKRLSMMFLAGQHLKTAEVCFLHQNMLRPVAVSRTGRLWRSSLTRCCGSSLKEGAGRITVAGAPSKRKPGGLLWRELPQRGSREDYCGGGAVAK